MEALTSGARYDAVILGGGVLGCTVALLLAEAGMSVAVVEARRSLCTQASGVNTGHIGVMSGRPYRVPLALRSMELWAEAPARFGRDIGYRVKTGLKVAFTDEEAEALERSIAEMVEAGATLELVGANRARELEPALSDRVRLAAFSVGDGYANPLLVGSAMREALAAAGVDVRLGSPVAAIDGGPPYRVQAGAQALAASRLLIAGGVWIERLAAFLGVNLPVVCRVSQVTVTERQPPVFARAISAASGILSLKQVENGTVLIGGGWQGIGDPESGPREVVPENVIGNLRLACAAIPGLARARAMRTWLGLEARAVDNMPLAGPLPGFTDAYVLGAVHTGFALSPVFGQIMADLILGRAQPEPAFDPARLQPPPERALSQ